MEVLRVILPEVIEHSEVRAVPLRNIHKRQIFIATPLYLPGTEYASTIGVDQYRNDQLWMIGMLAQDTILLFQAVGIELFKQISIEVAFVIIWQ